VAEVIVVSGDGRSITGERITQRERFGRRMFGQDFDKMLATAREGDADALEILYRALYPPVHAYMANQLSPHDAEDAASDVFVSVARGLSNFNGGETSFRSWVFTIAHHRLVDHHRARARQRTNSLPPEELVGRAGSGDAENDALEVVGTGSVLNQIATLPPAQAEVVLLRVVADLSVADVATIVGRKPEAVRALQFRAMHRLARELGQTGEASAS
jgi:RNA polymerase sigma factor (sigma-70 family)